MNRTIIVIALCLLVLPAGAETVGEWWIAHRDVLLPAARLCGLDGPSFGGPVDTPQCNELHGYLQEMQRLWAIADAKRAAEQKKTNDTAIERALELYRSRVPFSEDR